MHLKYTVLLVSASTCVSLGTVLAQVQSESASQVSTITTDCDTPLRIDFVLSVLRKWEVDQLQLQESDCQREEKRLLEMRWCTVELCNALSTSVAGDRVAYLSRLQWMLGILKDANSIGTLQSYWSLHNSLGMDEWLLGWTQGQAYFINNTDEWENVESTWESMFEWVYKNAPKASSRRAVIAVLDEWCHNAAAADMLRRVALESKDDEEVAIADGALCRRGQSNGSKLRIAIDRLWESARHEEAYSLIRRYPQADFVPTLIRFQKQTHDIETDTALRRITFLTKAPNSWEEWWEKHCTESRTEWATIAIGDSLVHASRDEMEVPGQLMWLLQGPVDPLEIEILVRLAECPKLARRALAEVVPTMHEGTRQVLMNARTRMMRDNVQWIKNADVLEASGVKPTCWGMVIERMQPGRRDF